MDENNKRLSAEIVYETFSRIEEIFEDHALYHLIHETDDSEFLTLTEAKKYYRQLLKFAGGETPPLP